MQTLFGPFTLHCVVVCSNPTNSNVWHALKLCSNVSSDATLTSEVAVKIFAKIFNSSILHVCYTSYKNTNSKFWGVNPA